MLKQLEIDTEKRVTMSGYERECAEIFLREQTKLLGSRVIETVEEAIEFLEDCFAVVLDSAEAIRYYWDENGMDVTGMTDEDILNAAEVFLLPSGKYLVVEA